MKRVHIVGGKNHGKTTLVCDLVAEFRRRGMQVATIKHTHHNHELDSPGKDSHRHRQAGAAAVGILTRSMHALFWSTPPTDSDRDNNNEERYEAFAPSLGACDLVLVEGDTQTGARKVEVWREALQTPLLAGRVTTVDAIVTDDTPGVDVPIVRRSNVPEIADLVWNLLTQR